ncbi:U32 family peptidase [bacterium]|nr:U32 family peptidase [bacterium]
MMNKTPELLAPAGDFEALQAAIQAGCDAVYFGVSDLNMRAKKSTDSFRIIDLAKIRRICTKARIRCYAAINTLLYDRDLNKAQKIILAAKKYKIDAVIAADAAVLQYCKQCNLATHISTQLSISNIEALCFYSQFADRVVLARELSLAQIKMIVDQIKKRKICGPGKRLVEIELFAHGARCIAISGRCWMSLYAHNESANRGVCRQLCRRAYTVVDQMSGEELDIDNNYVMSPKDLCTIEFLDKLVATGVKALKIEGRSRSSEYVYTVTKAYRQALDAIALGTYTKKRIAELSEPLKKVYHRGYSPGYYLGKKPDDWSGKYGSHATQRKVYCGKVINYYARHQVAHIKIEASKLKVNDEVILTGPTTGVLKFKIAEIRNEEKVSKTAEPGESVTIKVPEKVRVNDRLHTCKVKKQI